MFHRDLGFDISPDREAQALAKLDHPGIVSIYDTGIFDERPFFVSNHVPGPTLTECLRTHTFPPDQAADLIAQLCDAVAHAHSRGLVLRDLKPSNIILENGVRPVLIDLGIALFEENYGIDPLHSAGTLAYMSPEQASGRGHLADERSDIYSLGAILYELLAGRIPFDGHTQTTVSKICNDEPERPTLRNPNVPERLGQICTKALAKLPADRYQSASEMAAALRAPSPSELVTPSEHTELKFAPKGLRAFDSEDANTFLDLLPGERDANGLPESVHFWTSRIGPPDEAELKRGERIKVGIIHGLSGTGKSSLLRAGIIPRLHPSVIPIFTEAASGPFEHRLVSSLRYIDPFIAPDADLVDAIRSIGQGRGGRPILIAIDQFEQWLCDWDGGHGNELVRALRQIDESRLQCVFIVRDDFWSSMGKFMEAIGCEIHQNHNTRGVDLFEKAHAEKILTAYGQALGSLPEEPDEQQRKFVERAISALSDNQERKAFPVQIALLAEVFKSRPWEPAELEKIGGTRAIGSLFLDQSFLHHAAPARYRFHANAAAQVLGRLLPAGDLSIRAHAVGIDELRDASSYTKDPKAFDSLLQILDTELRLVTPSEPEEEISSAASYQITHDYLVPSIREWIDRQRSDTARGRAKLRLEKLSTAWDIDRDRRHLPGGLDCVRIFAHTDRQRWTRPQRNLMSVAGKRLLVYATGFTLLAAGLIFFLTQNLRERNLQKWIADVRSSQTEEITTLLGDRFPAKQPDPIELRRHFDAAATGTTERFNLGLVLMRLNPSSEIASEIFPHLLQCPPSQFAAACPFFLNGDPDLDSRVSQAIGDGASTPPAVLFLLLAGGNPLEFDRARAVVTRFLDQRPEVVADWLKHAPTTSGLRPLLEKFTELPPSDPKLERHKAMATLSRALLGNATAIFDLLAEPEMQVRQAYLINSLHPAGIPEKALVAHLATNPISQVEGAILLALKSYSTEADPSSPAAMRALEKIYASTESAYSHSTAEYLMRHWGDDVPKLPQPLPEPGDSREWFTTSTGTKMVIIKAQPESDVPYDFAISTMPVLYDQFKLHGDILGIMGGNEEGFPAHDLNLYHAMHYCVKLSEAEGLEPCYQPAQPNNQAVYEPVADYLQKNGYRVPTRAENRLATQGSRTPCEVPAHVLDLIDDYEWTRQNSGDQFHPPGWLRPNGFGLFDPLSNFSEWMLDPVDLPPDLQGRDRIFKLQQHCYQRSGSCFTKAELILVGENFGTIPGNQLTAATFRLVRPLPNKSASDK